MTGTSRVAQPLVVGMVPILGVVPSVELEPGEPPVEAQLLQRWPAHVRRQPLRRENRFF